MNKQIKVEYRDIFNLKNLELDQLNDWILKLDYSTQERKQIIHDISNQIILLQQLINRAKNNVYTNPYESIVNNSTIKEVNNNKNNNQLMSKQNLGYQQALHNKRIINKRTRKRSNSVAVGKTKVKRSNKSNKLLEFQKIFSKDTNDLDKNNHTFNKTQEIKKSDNKKKMFKRPKKNTNSD